MPKTFLAIGALLGSVLGVMAASVTVYLAFKHNPNCELYCDDSGLQYSAVSGLFFGTTVIVGGIIFIVSGLVPAAVLGLLSVFSRSSCNANNVESKSDG